MAEFIKTDGVTDLSHLVTGLGVNNGSDMTSNGGRPLDVPAFGAAGSEPAADLTGEVHADVSGNRVAG
jgi:hypothetical protein